MNETIIFIDSILYNTSGLLFVILGVFLLIRVTGFPDLTVDGSFTVGAAIYAVTLAAGYNTLIALLLASLSGGVSGLITWFINNVLGVGRVISSVLSMIILILSAPYLSGGSTTSLLHVASFNSMLEEIDTSISNIILGSEVYHLHFLFFIFWLLIFTLFVAITNTSLQSRLGLQLRYLGMVKSPILLSKTKQKILLLIGLVSGNSLVAIGGAIEAQRRGGFTLNMGTGILLVALAILILGESVTKSYRKREHLYLREYILSILIGSTIYNAGVQIILLLGINIVDLRLVTALFLLILLGIAGRYHSSSTSLF